MYNPYLIQNFNLNGMEIIFNGIQFLVKFIFHSFHDVFQLQQFKFHNFTFFQSKGDIWRFNRCVNILITIFHFLRMIIPSSSPCIPLSSTFWIILNGPSSQKLWKFQQNTPYKTLIWRLLEFRGMINLWRALISRIWI